MPHHPGRWASELIQMLTGRNGTAGKIAFVTFSRRREHRSQEIIPCEIGTSSQVGGPDESIDDVVDLDSSDTFESQLFLIACLVQAGFVMDWASG